MDCAVPRKNNSVRQRSSAPAGVRALLAGTIGGLVLVAGGAGYRVLAAHLDRAPVAPLPAGMLASLPLALGDWCGRDVSLGESVIRAADVDDHVSRVYTSPGQTLPINLFIALGSRARDLMPHRPEVCYPGAGWTLRRQAAESVVMSDGGELETTIYTFGRGDLGGRTLVVLNFFVVDGRPCRDVSLLRSRAWRGQASIRYMAQVQVVAAVEAWQAESAGVGAACDFAAKLASPLCALLADATAGTPTHDVSGENRP